MKDEFDYTIESLDQLDDFQLFYNEWGLCQVMNVVDDMLVDYCGYSCEVIEPYYECLDKEGHYFILEIGDRIRLT
jgi:hypothetical protein